MTALGSIQDPDLRALLQGLKTEIFAGLNCHQVGQIESFDAASQTATVSLLVQRVVFNLEQSLGAGLQLTPRIVNYPILVDIPVFVLSGGGAVITCPVAAGDSCLVLFNDRDLDNWFATGAPAQPNTARMHSIADGLALVGFRSKRNPVGAYSTTDAEIRNVPLGGRVSVGAKIAIANNSTDLKTALDALMTALLGWVDTHGDTPNPATIAALNAAKAQIDALLKS